MTAYIVRRLLQGVVVLFLISAVTFLLINLAPGGPTSAVSLGRTAEEREAVLRQYGLDRPVLVRYFDWLGGVLRGDLGKSYNQGLPVASLLAQRMGNTLQLALTALALTALLGVALGVLSALYKNRWPDHLISSLATVGMSVPAFWLGIVAIIVFAVQLKWLPSSGIFTVGQEFSLADRLRHLAMPAGVLAFTLMPNVIRITRSALLEVLTSDYVRTARAKGLSERVVLLKHTLKNAMVPVIAILGLITTVLFSGSVVVESVFGWAGLGRLAIEAANGRDYPVILGVTLLVGAIVVAVNLLVDVLYAAVDPRISHE
ncbi:Glutathione transport system permease protein GsiC [Calidithermus terrae]|uniref:Glutathione transport system permease protein GsiC n=1 Tax=Calidithermus terrae TaxID=1408545 RepID=A0A399EJX6_9DEIN|nr:ABC transporter permease [Calidithermus terrae]RIH83763.1 Glutathione transport system permease protein GsiC [Calidithermus terrae]